MGRHRGGRAVLTAAVTTGAMVLGVASLAFACSPYAKLTSLSSSIGLPGDTITVSGGDFWSSVLIRWGGFDGPVLATAANGTGFTVPVRIPESAQPGTYLIAGVPTAPALNGQVAYRPTRPFTVLRPASPPPPAPSKSVSTGGGVPSPPPGEGGKASGGTTPHPVSGGPTAGAAQRVPTAPFTGAAAPTSGNTAAAGPARSGESPAVAFGAPAADSGQLVTGSDSPSPLAASSDLWRGLTPGKHGAAAALGAEGHRPTEAPGGGSGRAVLLVSGLLALTTGVVVMRQSHRRVRSRAV